MSAGEPSDTTFFGGLFGWRKREEPKPPEKAGQGMPTSHTNHQRIISFRIDEELDRRLSRALRGKSCSQSDFIRNAIQRVLKQDGEERLRAAHSAIRWD
jgi:hypothetical protein